MRRMRRNCWHKPTLMADWWAEPHSKPLISCLSSPQPVNGRAYPFISLELNMSIAVTIILTVQMLSALAMIGLIPLCGTAKAPTWGQHLAVAVLAACLGPVAVPTSCPALQCWPPCFLSAHWLWPILATCVLQVLAVCWDAAVVAPAAAPEVPATVAPASGAAQIPPSNWLAPL